ncbi:MAG: ATP-binding protein [Microthrixaceae bacterium]
MDALSALVDLPVWTNLAGAERDHEAEVEASASPVSDLAGLEDVLGHMVGGELGWLVVARPIGRARLDSALDAARVLAGSVVEDRLDSDWMTRGWRRRFREIELAKSQGLWSIHLLVGATDEEHLAEYEQVLAAAVAVSSAHYQVAPTGRRLTLDLALSVPPAIESVDPFVVHELQAPFVAPTSFLDLVARVPERELPGWRLEAPNPFDVSFEQPPPSDDDDSRPYCMGAVLDVGGVAVSPFTVTDSTLVRHTFVCGATGGGKSQTVRGLLDELSAQQRPWLVIEPAKAEYGAAMASRRRAVGPERGAVHVIRIGDLDVPPAMLNPLEPEPGFDLQAHIELVEALFLTAFEAVEPFPQVLASALRAAYLEHGWHLDTGEHERGERTYPSLLDLDRAAARVVEEVGYGAEVRGNVAGFMKVRLGSLRLGSSGRFFEGGHPIDLGALLEHDVVFEIDRVGSDQDKAFVMGVLLLRIYEHLSVRARIEQEAARHIEDRSHRGRIATLRHLTVIEEAHRLLRRPREGESHAVETFAAMLAEVRAYGEGLVIAEQIPTKVIPDVVKNTALRIVHRLPAGDDRELVGASMNLSEQQSEAVVALQPGRAAVFSEGMDHPALVAIGGGTAREREPGHQDAVSLPFLLRDAHQAGSAMADHLLARRSARQIAAARRFVSAHPELELWVEIVALAGLTEVGRLTDATPAALDRFAGLVATHRPATPPAAIAAELAWNRVSIRPALGAPRQAALAALLRTRAEVVLGLTPLHGAAVAGMVTSRRIVDIQGHSTDVASLPELVSAVLNDKAKRLTRERAREAITLLTDLGLITDRNTAWKAVDRWRQAVVAGRARSTSPK